MGCPALVAGGSVSASRSRSATTSSRSLRKASPTSQRSSEASPAPPFGFPHPCKQMTRCVELRQAWEAWGPRFARSSRASEATAIRAKRRLGRWWAATAKSLWCFGNSGGGGVVVVRSFFGAGRRQRRLLAEAAVGLASLMIAAVATISCFLTQPGSLA